MMDLSKAKSLLNERSLPIPGNDIDGLSITAAFEKSSYVCLSLKNPINYSKSYYSLNETELPLLNEQFHIPILMDMERAIINEVAKISWIGKGSDLTAKHLSTQFGSPIVQCIKKLSKYITLKLATENLVKEAKDDLIWNESEFAKVFINECKLLFPSSRIDIQIFHYFKQIENNTAINITNDDIMELLEFSIDSNLVKELESIIKKW